MPLSEKQRGVRKGVVIGGTVKVVCIVASLLLGPELLGADAIAAEKIAFSRKADVFIVI